MDLHHARKVVQGDNEAFRYFIRKYKDLAYSVALSMVKNESDAEDITQDSFVKAYKSIDSFIGSSFSSCLYRIVLN